MSGRIIRSEAELAEFAKSGGGLTYVSADRDWPHRGSGDYFFKREREVNLFFRQYHDGVKLILALDAFSCPTEGINFDEKGIIIPPPRRERRGVYEALKEMVETLRGKDLWVEAT